MRYELLSVTDRTTPRHDVHAWSVARSALPCCFHPASVWYKLSSTIPRTDLTLSLETKLLSLRSEWGYCSVCHCVSPAAYEQTRYLAYKMEAYFWRII